MRNKNSARKYEIYWTSYGGSLNEYFYIYVVESYHMVYFYLVSIGDLADSNRNRAFARWKMKICGCSSCRRNGEINPYEQFEIYLLQREESSKDNFKTILAAEFSAQELNELETEFIIPSVADKINQHVPFDAQSYWMKYGGSLRGFQELNEY